MNGQRKGRMMKQSEYYEKMSQLAESFPTIGNLSGVRPWDAKKFAKQYKSQGRTSASRSAILFVLGVWNPGFWCEDFDLKAHPFNMHHALQSWDRQHREAFVSWVSDPWWP
jgi:hypothetical protein